MRAEKDSGAELGTKLTVKPYCTNGQMLMEKKCELRDNLRGVRTGFELARRMAWGETLAERPVRAVGDDGWFL